MLNEGQVRWTAQAGRYGGILSQAAGKRQGQGPKVGHMRRGQAAAWKPVWLEQAGKGRAGEEGRERRGTEPEGPAGCHKGLLGGGGVAGTPGFGGEQCQHLPGFLWGQSLWLLRVRLDCRRPRAEGSHWSNPAER